MDRTTEAIAHFAGSFDLTDDALRIRIDLPDGPRPGDGDVAPPAIHTFATHFRFPYEPEGFVPGLDYTATPVAAQAPIPADFAATLRTSLEPLSVVLQAATSGGRFHDIPAAPTRTSPQEGETKLLVPVPNSYAGVTIQVVRLSDDDLYLEGGWAGFAAPAAAVSRLHDLAEDADAAHVFAFPALSGQTGSWAEFAAAARNVVDTDQGPLSGDGFETVTLRADAASGIVVTGGAEEDMPLWSELLPVFLRDEDGGDGAGGETEDRDGELAAPRNQAGSEYEAGTADAEDLSGLVTGGNEAVNEVASTTTWIDAPIISVMGDVWKIDAISQISILRDRDAGTDGGADDAVSRVTSAAEITETSSDPARAGGGDDLPSAWSVTRIEGDLVSMNKVVQDIYATDNDRVELVSSGRESFLSTGENVLQDAASFLAYGFQYDLVVVGGDMIDLSMIRQTNVLLDDDTATGVTGGGPVSAGDNSLFNAASLTKTGIDTFAEMTDVFRDAGAELAQGARDLSAELAREAIFTGMDALRALYIDGDFVEIDLVEQSIIFSDADQVASAIGEGLEAAANAAEAILGSNAQANIARLHDEGLDSTIMAGGDVYSDALIHQASLLDDEADPAGVMMQGLASEAVAFLADGMLEPELSGEPGGMDIQDDGGTPFDVMQTMLA